MSAWLVTLEGQAAGGSMTETWVVQADTFSAAVDAAQAETTLSSPTATGGGGAPAAIRLSVFRTPGNKRRL